jgi:UDPglucose 6-dehydrogenase
MKITVVGTGYVGLVSGACLAEMGNDVLCLDLDPEKIRILKEGGIPIHEPGLDQVVARNVAAGRLHFTTDVQEAVQFGTIQFIAVGTPPDEDGSADLQYVLSAAKAIGRHMTDYKVIVDKSTVPVGTADKVKAAVRAELDARGEHSLQRRLEPRVPERGRRGRRLHAARPHRRRRRGRPGDLPDEGPLRAVPAQPREAADHGSAQRRAHQVRRQRHAGDAHQLHERAGAARRNPGRRHRTGPPRHRQRSAHRLSLPVCRLRLRRLVLPEGREGADQDRRRFRPHLRVLNAVEDANDAQKLVLVDKVVERFGEDLSGKHFAVWGLAFKPNTDDMREAPSRVIIAELFRRGATVTAYDPVAMPEAAVFLARTRALFTPSGRCRRSMMPTRCSS